MTEQQRMDDMLRRYGEVVNLSKAGQLLGRNRATIRQMLRDGRLDAACGGTMVDVRSIVRYILTPAQAREDDRIERIRRKTGSKWAV